MLGTGARVLESVESSQARYRKAEIVSRDPEAEISSGRVMSTPPDDSPFAKTAEKGGEDK